MERNAAEAVEGDKSVILHVGIKSRGAVTRAPASIGGEARESFGAGQNMWELVAVGALIPGILDRLAAQMEQRRYGERDHDKPPEPHLPSPVIAVGAVANDAAESVCSKGYESDCGGDENGGHAAARSVETRYASRSGGRALSRRFAASMTAARRQ
jgi:hypothetical protein